MKLWKQILSSLVLVIAGLALCVWLVPGTTGLLASAGVPTKVLGLGKTDEKAASGERSGDGSGGNRRGGGRRGGASDPLVIVQPVAVGLVNDRLSALGTGEAIQTVTVTPQVSGTLSDVTIKSGDRIEKGDVIARLDNEEQTIARDQAQVTLNSATEKSQLFTNLKSAVSRIDAFDADIALQTAKLALRNADMELKRRDVVAPISGIVGIITVNVGDNVTTSTSIATIDDRSELLVDFWVPERFTALIDVGQPLDATAVARPGDLYEGTVAAVDNRIDQASRTLRVRAKIPNADDDLRAGMAFTVSMSFKGERHPAVDPLAIQWDSSGAYVWRIVDGKAEKVAVRVIQRNPDNVMVEADLADGDKVVTEGVQRVRAGRGVRIDGEEPPAGKADGDKLAAG